MGMKRIKIRASIIYDDEMMHGDDQDAIKWFFNDILGGDELRVWSETIGDDIGSLRDLSIEEVEGQAKVVQGKARQEHKKG